MGSETVDLLNAFDHLPEKEKQLFALEVLKRSLPFDSGPLSDEEIGAAANELFQSLDDDGNSTPR